MSDMGPWILSSYYIFKWLAFWRNTVDLMPIFKKKKSLFLLLRMKGDDLDQIVMTLFSVE